MTVTLPGDTSTDEPSLLPLTTDNGGVTATHALAAGSPAIDAGANPDSLVSDQRGFPHHRVVGISADQILATPRRVAVAGGKRKFESIRAALRGKWITTLITDLDVAQALLDD